MIPKALTIAGSDSGGGAGIQADLKVFSRLKVFGMSVITALTAQNTVGVTGVFNVTPEFVALQFDAVMTDLPADAAKTGMLSTAEIIEAVADRVRFYGLRQLVVDPVMISKSGASLLQSSAVDALKRELIPLALVVTPNADEAQVLSGVSIRSVEDLKEAARRIYGMGCRHVLVKGGHLDGDATDVLYDGAAMMEFSAPRSPTSDTHGTGCVLSAAITGYLARGESPSRAVEHGKSFVTEAIHNALRIGAGHGPCDPLALER